MNDFFRFEVMFPLLLAVVVIAIATVSCFNISSDKDVSVSQIEYKKWETMQTLQSNDSKCQQDLKFYKNLYEIRNQ